jgi:hypothetical protein
MPLRIAAKIPRAETAYFRKHLEPHPMMRKFGSSGRSMMRANSRFSPKPPPCCFQSTGQNLSAWS